MDQTRIDELLEVLHYFCISYNTVWSDLYRCNEHKPLQTAAHGTATHHTWHAQTLTRYSYAERK